MSSTVRNPISNRTAPVKRPSAKENLELNSDSDSIIYSDESENDDDIDGDSSFDADTYAGTPNPDSLRISKNTAESPLHYSTYRAQSQKRKEEETGILSTIKEERGGEDDDESYEESDDSESSDEDSSDSEDPDGSDSGTESGSESTATSSKGSRISRGRDEIAIVAQPMGVLNVISCSLFEVADNPYEESVRSGQSVSSSDEDDEGDISEGEGGVELGTYSRQERERATAAFYQCASLETKHLSESQFGVTLALLGQTERRDILKDLYDDLAVSDGLAVNGFLVALNRLRQRGNEEDALNRIQDAFSALYEGTCPNDDQKDFTGQRYIYANDFRLLLTEIGEDTERLTDEEANELLRECRPIYPKVINPRTGNEEEDGIAASMLRGRIFFEQYRAMLLDICP